MVETAIAASKDWSSNGRLSAAAATRGAAPAGRCARMSADGSTAVTSRPGGSWEPVPSPDIQYRPRIAEPSPDPGGDPRLGAPRHGVSGADGVIQLRAGHVAALSGCHHPHAAHVALRRCPGYLVTCGRAPRPPSPFPGPRPAPQSDDSPAADRG